MPTASAPIIRNTVYAPSNNFSLLETHVIAAMLIPHFQLRLKPGHQPQVVMEGTIASKNGMPMTLHPREEPPRA